MTDIPKCHYCGKIVNIKSPDIVFKQIYGHLDIEAQILFHKKCEPKKMNQDIQNKIDTKAKKHALQVWPEQSMADFVAGARSALSSPELMKEAMVNLIQHIKDYERESGELIGYDSRTAEEFFDLYIEHLKQK